MSGNIQYQSLHDEILHLDTHRASHDDSTHLSSQSPHRFPVAIGVTQIISGFITAYLGTLEVFIVPLLEGEERIKLDKRNCFGAGIWAGLLMVITGSTAIRTTISKRDTTVGRFYTLSLFTFLLYAVVTVVLMVGYSKGWTTKDKFPEGSRVFEVHVFVTIFCWLGLLFTVAALVSFFNLVFSERVRLDKKWLSCILCWIPNVDLESKSSVNSTDRNYLM